MNHKIATQTAIFVWKELLDFQRKISQILYVQTVHLVLSQRHVMKKIICDSSVDDHKNYADTEFQVPEFEDRTFSNPIWFR